ncbi:MAG TPA: MTH1187 family thiamine-binding protein [Anaerolineae bacterium]|nr:MTH1187 family thiamine-binding protein [Anaerolineae bacterium]HMR67039.1 MTH1187 family thiamine-binding protein [Anaerolineae bacterium]
MANPVNVSIEVLPLHQNPYPIVDKAIAVIQAAGVKYEVGPMETTMEGDLDELLAVVKQVHRACFVEGVEHVVTVVKIGESVHGTSIEGKVSKYR